MGVAGGRVCRPAVRVAANEPAGRSRDHHQQHGLGEIVSTPGRRFELWMKSALL